MVFLRLTVKILPREQLVTTSSSSSIRSTLSDPSRKEEADSNGNDAAGKAASFLLVLQNPEEVTLGSLARMILEKWTKLRPEAEPLEIKKLVDNEHDQDDLDTDLTVADVFVDNGKARADGLDQRATVRVIQKPTPFASVRYSSVVQDWPAAAKDYRRFGIIKGEDATRPPAPRFGSIPEEPRRVSLAKRTSSELLRGRELSMGENPPSNRISQSDLPVLSVERDDMEMLMSPHHWRTTPPLDQEYEIAPTPQGKRLASQELGHSPIPVLQPTMEPPLSPAEDFVRRQGTESVMSGGSRSALDSPSPEGQGRDQKENPAAIKPGPEIASTVSAQDVEMTDEEPLSSPLTDDMNQPSFRYKSPVVVIDNTNKPENTSLTERFLNVAKRKRKASVGHLPRSKEPRLELTPAPSDITTRSTKQPEDKKIVEANGPSPPPSQKSDRGSCYSGPQRRPGIAERPAELTKTGLGLGITKSPPRKKFVSSKIITDRDAVAEREDAQPSPLPNVSTRRRSWSQQNDITPAKGQSPSVEQAKRLPSALRKDSPSDRHLERRSVSFAEDSQFVAMPSVTAPRKSTSRPVMSASKDTSKHSQTTSVSDQKQAPATGIMVFPENERLEQYLSEAAQKFSKIEQEKMEWERKIKIAEENGDPEHLRLLRDVFSCWTEMTGLGNKSKMAGRLNKLRQALAKKEKLLREKEEAMAMGTASSKPEGEKGEVERSSRKEAPRLDFKNREGKPASKTNGVVAASSASEDGDLPPSVSVRSSEATTATKLSRPSKPIAQIIARRNIRSITESSDELIENLNSESKNDAIVEKAPQSLSKKNEINTNHHGQMPPETSKAETLRRARSSSHSSSINFSSDDLSDHEPAKGVSSKVGNGIHSPPSTKQDMSKKSEINTNHHGQMPPETSKAETLRRARSSYRSSSINFPSDHLSDHEPAKGVSSKVGNSIHSPPSTKQDVPLAAGQSKPNSASQNRRARSSSSSSINFSSDDLSDHEPAKGVSSKVGNNIHSPPSTKQDVPLAAGQSKPNSASQNRLRSLRDRGLSASGSPSSTFPSSSPSLQHRPPQQNGVKSHVSLKTLLQAQKAEMERKVPDVERPKRPSAIQPAPREDVDVPPSETESSTSENESESEDEKTDSSGDDSRGDIMPTGAANKMRPTVWLR